MEDLDKYLGFREAKAGELLFRDCLRRFETTASRAAMIGMFKIKEPGPKTSKVSMTPVMNPVMEASVAITASSITASAKDQANAKGQASSKPVQRKISGFLLDAQIVSTNDKRRAKKAKEEKEEKA
jgi:hypothetical protein